MNPTIDRQLLASLLTSIALAAGLGACGGGDDSKQEGKASTERGKVGAQDPKRTGITEEEVNALQLNTPLSEVEQRFGEPVDPKGVVPAGILKGEPNGLSCSYYRVKGGPDRDFVQLCFKQGKLGSKLSLTTPRR